MVYYLQLSTSTFEDVGVEVAVELHVRLGAQAR